VRQPAYAVLTPRRASLQIVNVLTFVFGLAWPFLSWGFRDEWVAAIIVGSYAALYFLLWIAIAAVLPEHLRFLNDPVKTSGLDSPGPHSLSELFDAWRNPAWRCRNLSHRLPLPDDEARPRNVLDPLYRRIVWTQIWIVVLAFAALMAVKTIPILTKPYKTTLFVLITAAAIVIAIIKLLQQRDEIPNEAVGSLIFPAIILVVMATYFIA